MCSRASPSIRSIVFTNCCPGTSPFQNFRPSTQAPDFRISGSQHGTQRTLTLIAQLFAQLSLSEGPVLTPSRVPVSSVEHIAGVVCKIAHEKGIDLSLSRQ